jgi:dipeptidyl aminopeptidase/acylaminoacyl peptidase
MKLKIIFLTIVFLIFTKLYASVNEDDYMRADSAFKFNNYIFNNIVASNWIDSSNFFWYRVKVKTGYEYKLVDAVKSKVTNAIDLIKLSEKINKKTGAKTSPDDLNLRNLEFVDNRKAITFELKRTIWKCDLKSYELTKVSDKKEDENERYWGESGWEFEGGPSVSPDSSFEALVKEYNIYLKEKKSGEEIQLSYDGSSGDSYSSDISWSPDSKYIAVYKIRKHEKRFIHFVESSPKDQLQPILHKREYLKPGDALPIKRPCLFNIASREKINLNTDHFENQFDLSGIKWWKDSRTFTFEFNQRGHQLYQVAEVDVSTGSIRILIEEKSNTFIDYSSKHYRYDIDDKKEIIWASERDGWNHLYLFDAVSGKLKNQITKGEWVVRQVIKVNEKEGTIIFTGSGKNPDEDPYFIHYYKINFDGIGLTDLTPEPKNHNVSFSYNDEYYVDTYSTVNCPPFSVLKKVEGCEILDTLEKADINELLAKGWKEPEVFVAKGRDEKTDIWGNIYFPTNFDASKKYPVIEYIYAGPQDSYVQKSFRAFMYSFSGLAELGFIIVTIDGMGTSNRSKAFHDVCYKNIKDAGFPDRIKWMKSAAEKRSYMDISRVGIFGSSAGGQNALSGLLFFPDFYKAGVASCGCHDNRMDKMWWNEQWMGYPVDKHYEECSNVVNAEKLEGKLMLIVGEMDDNVDPASTMQVANALIKAEKDFELVVLPGVNHTLGEKYGENKRRDFFVKYLLGDETPDRNIFKKKE